MTRSKKRDLEIDEGESVSMLRPRSRDRGTAGNDINIQEKQTLETEESDLTGDYGNIALLLLLYTLQGIPMGLSAAIPMVLQEKGASLAELGKFSFCSWPFSLKILWAPIVDSLYSKRVGLRKSWLIPSQLCIGFSMVIGSWYIDEMLGDASHAPDVGALTSLFFLLFLMCATQDIAVDGWALTMLQPRNIAYASTCNAIGQAFGNAVAFVGFLALNHYGLMELPSFMLWCGIVFVAITIGVALFKAEQPSRDIPNMTEAYAQMFQVLRCPAVMDLLLVLFSSKVGFACADALTSVKLQSAGMPKEHIAYLGILLTPISIFLPGLLAAQTAGPRPLGLFMDCYVPRLVIGLLSALLVFYAPSPWPVEGMPWPFYGLVLVLSAAFAMASTSMFVAQMAFFAKVSDPKIGGTYMTMLNTAANLGFKWPNSLIFFLVDWSTVKASDSTVESDGYYLWSMISVAIGACWFMAMRKLVVRLQARPLTD